MDLLISVAILLLAAGAVGGAGILLLQLLDKLERGSAEEVSRGRR